MMMAYTTNFEHRKGIDLNEKNITFLFFIQFST